MCGHEIGQWPLLCQTQKLNQRNWLQNQNKLPECIEIRDFISYKHVSFSHHKLKQETSTKGIIINLHRRIFFFCEVFSFYFHGSFDSSLALFFFPFFQPYHISIVFEVTTEIRAASLSLPARHIRYEVWIRILSKLCKMKILARIVWLLSFMLNKTSFERRKENKA